MRAGRPLGLLALAAVAALAGAAHGSEQNPPLPPIARAECPRAAGPIRVDGILNEAAWRRAGRLELAHRLLGKPGRPMRPTRVLCLWDAKRLYLAFIATDPDVWSTYRRRDASLWEEEVVEAYLDPTGSGRGYKEFEVNPLGAGIELRIADPARLTLADTFRYRAWNAPGWRWAVRVRGTLGRRTDRDRSWTVEMGIPFASVGERTPRPGKAWRAQFYRIERPRGRDPEFSSWSATDAFHNPARFGRLLFSSLTRR